MQFMRPRDYFDHHRWKQFLACRANAAQQLTTNDDYQSRNWTFFGSGLDRIYVEIDFYNQNNYLTKKMQ